MKIAILDCDRVDADLVASYGEYSAMFIKQLQPLDETLEFTVFDALNQQLPPADAQFAGYIITGSRHNAYDDDPWILSLLDWFEQAYARSAKIAGICFGHQLIARAFGGTVAKSPKGWGLGSSEVNLSRSPKWVTDIPQHVCLWVSHQDQVLECPSELEVIAGNDFCPYFMLAKDRQIFTVQGHPEFERGYTQELAIKQRADLTDEQWQQVEVSLQQRVDAQPVLQWILALFAQSA